MDLRFLQTFVHVAELGSISEAARFEDMTPASVRQRLQALDAAIGSQLLKRAGRTVQLTIAGRRILIQAKKILSDARDLRSMASDNELPAGPFHLGITPTALNRMAPAALKIWFAEHPDIEVYIEPGSSKTLYSRALDGTLDAAILVHPQFDIPKHMAQKIIRHEPLVLVTPVGMMIEDPLKALMQHPYICYDRSVLGGKLADEYLREHGIRPKARLELDGIDAIGKLVSEGLGVSLLPDTGTLNEGATGVKNWSLPMPVPERLIAIIWARNGARAPLAQAFAQLLIS